jgi:hypothetical protein
MRDERRLNALARGRLRARRGAESRFRGTDGDAARPGGGSQVAFAETLPRQRLVAVLAPVLGCADSAEPSAPATPLWLNPEC